MNPTANVFNLYINPFYPFASFSKDELTEAQESIRKISKELFFSLNDENRVISLHQGLQTSQNLLGKSYSFSFSKPSTWRNVFRAVAHFFGFSMCHHIQSEIKTRLKDWRFVEKNNHKEELVIFLEKMRNKNTDTADAIKNVLGFLKQENLFEGFSFHNNEALIPLAGFMNQERLGIYFDFSENSSLKRACVRTAFEEDNHALLLSFLRTDPSFVVQELFSDPSSIDENHKRKWKTLFDKLLPEQIENILHQLADHDVENCVAFVDTSGILFTKTENPVLQVFTNKNGKGSYDSFLTNIILANYEMNTKVNNKDKLLLEIKKLKKEDER